MRIHSKVLFAGSAIAILFAGSSCNSSGSSISDLTGGGGGTGAGGTFTASDIVKSWASDCTAQTDAVTGATYTNMILALNSGGTFSLQQYWYTNPVGFEGTCSPADYVIVYLTAGTYAVGGLTGSGSLQSMSFDVAPGWVELLASGNAAQASLQNNLNTDCGETSPYCTEPSGPGSGCDTVVASPFNGVAAGTPKATDNMLCMNHSFASSVGTTANNVASYGLGVLTLGVGTIGQVGVLSPGAAPTTATIAFH